MSSSCFKALQHGGNVVRRMGRGKEHWLELIGMEVDAGLLHKVLQVDELLEIAVLANVAVVGETFDFVVGQE